MSIVALLLAIVAVIIGALVLRRLGEARQRVPGLTSSEHERPERGEAPPSGPPAIVINPTKVANPDALRDLARELCAELGMPEPLWLPTTVDDPGQGQAREAIRQKASVVIAAGGDGTVREVASALAGSRTPMGLLPLGTANLLSRNLDLPLEGSTRSLLSTALTGAEHRIDVGWVRPDRLQPTEDVTDGEDGMTPASLADEHEHVFLVMAGVGFDAAMVADTGDLLKARMGWYAYFVAGVRHLHGRKVRVAMQIGDGKAIPLKLRSLLFANCGRLPGGMVLLPDAEINDGWLDIAALDTRGGLLGWASLFGKVVMQGVGVRRELPGQPGSIAFWRGKRIEVRCEEPGPIQVDGDLIGEAIGLQVRVEPGSLIVRTR